MQRPPVGAQVFPAVTAVFVCEEASRHASAQSVSETAAGELQSLPLLVGQQQVGLLTALKVRFDRLQRSKCGLTNNTHRSKYNISAHLWIFPQKEAF